MRNIIYSYALVPSGDRKISMYHRTCSDDGPKFTGTSPETNNALFLVSRQIYDEARVVFYNKVLFDLSDHVQSNGKLTLNFLQTRPESSLVHIRNIEFMQSQAWMTGRPQHFTMGIRNNLSCDDQPFFGLMFDGDKVGYISFQKTVRTRWNQSVERLIVEGTTYLGFSLVYTFRVHRTQCVFSTKLVPDRLTSEHPSVHA